MSAKHADNDVPVITGYQANDGLLFSAADSDASTSTTSLCKRQYGEMADEFLRLYPAKTAEEAKQMIAESIQDRDRVSMYLWASRRASNHRAPVFTVLLRSRDPVAAASGVWRVPQRRAALLLPESPSARPAMGESRTRDLAQYGSGYLKDFAAAGNPNGDHLPAMGAGQASPAGKPWRSAREPERCRWQMESGWDSGSSFFPRRKERMRHRSKATRCGRCELLICSLSDYAIVIAATS